MYILVSSVVIIILILELFLFYIRLRKNKSKNLEILSSLVEVNSINLSTKRYIELIKKETELEEIREKIEEMK